ncbi:hypothetical protein RFI_00532 [Reticulomyxa filosa]|uniref:Uncharacterized protein n=1 Tax=Reticulomyxa filosa TaxID=46433 RepID=X6PDG2_RETFI|nr:hypothetical protein RFI_00532 [Reticulomyxa filosa]|eukprot:ETO36530.1 hypothetical protein RFI_00532 [Reticulomyxa filosa]
MCRDPTHSKFFISFFKEPLQKKIKKSCFRKQFWFDYVKYANGEDSVKKTEETEKEYSLAATKKINDRFSWSFSREKIADPKFIDKIEIDHHVQKNTLQSITNISSLSGWDNKKIDSFEESFRKSAAEDEDAKQKVIIEELQKDYEQLDA